MNGGNQALDLCNERMKVCDEEHTAALISEELVLRSSIKFLDQDVEAADSGHEDKNDKEDLPTQKNNGTVLSVVSNVPEESSTQDLGSRFSIGSGNEDEDMDIGVDLSLDESGVLESDPVPALEKSSSVGSVASETDKDSDKPSEAVLPSPTGAETPTSPCQQEGAGHKPGAKRVTFPSDEDIVSGSVEPKDPWRHGEFMLLFSISRCR